MSHWRVKSLEVIDAAAIPAGATRAEAKAILSALYPFHARQYTPYKIWLEEVKRFLDRRYPEKQPQLIGKWELK